MQKTNTDIDQLNVRSLRIIKHLLESRSISNTAAFVGLSQPATSRVVAKLRRLLNDPLLVRVDGGYGLTPFAQQLYPKVVIALESIYGVLEKDEFEPAKIQTVVKVASTDYGTVCVLAKLYPVLLAQAPGIKLEISNFTPRAFSRIENGDLDLALYANFEIPNDFHYRVLFEEDYSILARRNHPLIAQGKAVTEKQLDHWPRAEILYPSTTMMNIDDVIPSKRSHEQSSVTAYSPYFLAAVSLIETTDTIAALPTRICSYAEKHYDVKSIRLKNTDSFTYVAIWHHRQHQRALLRWIVNQLAALF